jgi:hypothetical protein
MSEQSGKAPEIYVYHVCEGCFGEVQTYVESYNMRMIFKTKHTPKSSLEREPQQMAQC